MAYDPEARENSNTAMIIGIIALVLVVGGVLAYFATRPPAEPVAVVPPVVHRDTVVNNVPVPVPGSPSTVVVQPPAVAPPSKNTTTTTTTTIDRTKVLPGSPANPPAAGGGSTSGGGSSSTTIINNPPASGSGNAGNTASGSPSPAPTGY